MFRLNQFHLLIVLIFLRQTVHGSHIINGYPVPGYSMQYMVSVQSKGQHACGGFLISEDIVVTAAHCSEPEPDLVVVGSHDINSWNRKKIDIKYKCKHPNYKHLGLGDDIMLLKLSNNVSMYTDVKTIKIPTYNIYLHPNQICSVAGWGKTETRGYSHDLRMARVLIIDPHVCRREWGNTLPQNVICAGGYNTQKGFCQGDSGGPLVCNDIAVGVVSFNRGYNCNYPDVPNVYTDIFKYSQWIDRNTRSQQCVS